MRFRGCPTWIWLFRCDDLLITEGTEFDFISKSICQRHKPYSYLTLLKPTWSVNNDGKIVHLAQ